VVGSLLLSCGLAAGDGKFFSAADDVRQPNQKALLWLENGRETLILQVKYEGAAGDFGWVVPVPGRPKIDTAPSELFYELAVVTQPIVLRAGAAMWRGAGPVGAATEGVEVVERVQVGPYDATVLAATDEGSLANWLREHGYQMPPRAEEPLASYVERGWHYVALRFDIARLRKGLLTRLRAIEPTVQSLDNAPEQVAGLLVRRAERADPTGLEIARRIGEVLDTELGRTDQADGLAQHYDSVVDAGDPLEDGPVSASRLQRGLELDPRASEAVARAKKAGLCRGGSVAEAARELAASVNHDLRNDMPYGQSGWKRYPQLLAAFDDTELDPGVRAQYEHDYEAVRGLVRKSRVWPPLHPDEIGTWNPHDLGIVQDGVMSDVAAEFLRMLNLRGSLYHHTREALEETAAKLDGLLSSGTIEALRLEFDSKSLVYPLYITSIGRADTDIQLYVLSEHRLQASGFRATYEREFRTTFAGKLDEEKLRDAATLAGFVKPGRHYLTELRAKLGPNQMKGDVTFIRARRDKEFREKVMADGRVVVEVPAAGIVASFAWSAGIGLVALVTGIAIGRGLRPRRG
jgi:hypothetical protein